MIPQDIFLSSGQHLAIRSIGVDQFEIFDPANEASTVGTGSWSNMVDLSIKILATEARTNGGIPGLIFSAAQAYGDGICNGTISEQNEEYAQQLVAMIQQLKAM